MAGVETWQAKLDKVLHEKNAITDLLEKAEQKSGVRRLYLVSGLSTVVCLYLMIGYGAEFLCNFIGFLYPAYASVKAIESDDKEDDTKWLTYWVVYSTFSIVELFGDMILWWIPLYALLKCIFLVYCMVPTSWNGSLTIYNKIIRPFVLKHQAKVDEALDKAAGMASEVISEAEAKAKEAAGQAASQYIADSSKSE